MWAIGTMWVWGWSRAEWRGGMSEPNRPTMPRQRSPRPTAATWEQLDAIVHLATERAAKIAEVAMKHRINDWKPPRVTSYEWLRRTVYLLRGLGWRITQTLAINWSDVDLVAGTVKCSTGKGDRETDEGRKVPLAPWLLAEIKTWTPQTGRLVGPAKTKQQTCGLVHDLWVESGAPEAIYKQRPDHAFRIGLVTGLAELRADREAVEAYVGHAPTGVRARYVDRDRLPIAEVARLIPPVGSRVPGVSGGAVLDLSEARQRRR